MRSTVRSWGAETYPAPSLNLVDAYIDLLGSDEADHSKAIRALPRGNLRRTCMAIGRACWLYRQNPPAAMRMLRRAQTDLAPALAHPTATNDAPKFHSLTRLLLAIANPQAHERARHKLYGQTITSLENLRERQARGEKGHTMLTTLDWQAMAGKRVENRALAILNRPACPLYAQVIALPALVHHDKHKGKGYQRSRNFDLAVVGIDASESRANQLSSDPQTVSNASPAVSEHELFLRKVQLKSGCFGQCDKKGSAQERQASFEALRSLYGADITLISGCCDFRCGRKGASNDVDRLLVREFQGHAKAAEVVALDAVASRFLQIVKDGPELGRSGLYGVEAEIEEPVVPQQGRLPNWVYGIHT